MSAKYDVNNREPFNILKKTIGKVKKVNNRKIFDKYMVPR